jgi:hypothetical protein
MTTPQFQVHPTPAGFTVTAGSRTEEFEFGQINPADERMARNLAGYPVAPDFDVIRNSRGEFRWEPRALVKLRTMGLFAGFKADGSAIAQPDPIPFLIAAGIVQAPTPAAAPAPKEAAAGLDLIMQLPGAREFPEAAKAMAASGMTLAAARGLLDIARSNSPKNDPNRACNSQFGLILHQVPN